MNAAAIRLARQALTGSALLLVLPAAAQSVKVEAYGDAQADHFGAAVAAAGDVNGDGWPDVVVGMPFADPFVQVQNSGRARVVSGEWLAARAAGTTPLSPEVLFQWDGPFGASTNFGAAVAGGRDIDRDGVPDVAIGAPGDANGPYGPLGGSVQAFSGRTGQRIGTFYGGGYKTEGRSVALCDVNGDGWADVLAGAPGSVTTTSPFQGYVRAYSGEWMARTAAGQQPTTQRELHELRGDLGNDAFGWSLAALGDLDGDGREDFVVGAKWGRTDDRGFARVVSGRTGNALATLEGRAGNDLAGFSVAAAGDVNRDGTVDVIVGSPGWDVVLDVESAEGRAVVFSGEWIASTGAGQPPQTPRELFAIEGDLPQDRLGTSVGGAGDVDQDLHADVVVGARQAAGGGYARVCSGRYGDLIEEHAGASVGDQLGIAVAGLTDLDGDLRADVALGGPWMSDPQGAGTGLLRVAFARGTPVCFAAANSTGRPALLHAGGSGSTAANDLVLHVGGTPAGSRGVFLASPHAQGPLAFFDGYLCASSLGLVRVTSATAGADGTIARGIDLAGPWGAVLAPGTTWVFQCVYTDPLGVSGRNTTDGLSIPFTP